MEKINDKKYSADNILRCPFCNAPIEDPQEIKTKWGNSFTGGKCTCGTVYAYDRSGHNLGDVYVDAMAYACDDNLDKAWSLVPGEDYEVKELSYDSRRNKFSDANRRITSTFLFILIKNFGK